MGRPTEISQTPCSALLPKFAPCFCTVARTQSPGIGDDGYLRRAFDGRCAALQIEQGRSPDLRKSDTGSRCSWIPTTIKRVRSAYLGAPWRRRLWLDVYGREG